MNLLYNLFIRCYGLGIWMAALFNSKAGKWRHGRKQLFRKLEKSLQQSDGKYTHTVWFHCASLGEFEQGRPVMEQFRKLYPGYRIVLSFFSPSGYETRKNYSGADNVFYLPLDTPANVRKLLNLLQPKLVFLVKYEYWLNLISALHQRNIPVFVISAIFRANQLFFRGYGKWYREHLKRISWFFIQDENSQKLIESIGIKQFTITGDTRFDRVAAVAKERKSFPAIESFVADAEVFLGGSTWESDEELIFPLIRKNLWEMKFMIAPHETDPKRIKNLEEKLQKMAVQSPQSTVRSHLSPVTESPSHRVTESLVTRYSELTDKNVSTTRILVVDTIGILAHLYQYSTFSMIGGGFGVGIHNILEAVAFGNPVMFGPNYQKFSEAKALIRTGGAFCVRSAEDLLTITNRLRNGPEEYRKVSGICRSFVEKGCGASNRILQGIQNLGFIGPSEVRR